MSYDPRTIAFMGEILYQPMQLQAKAVQEIHNSLFQQPEISYQNFQVAADGVHLTNVPQSPGAISSVTFAPDRMILREELRGTTVEDFATRIVNVSTLAFRTLGIQVSLAQQFCVRTLVNPRQSKDSREFMAQRLIGAPEEAWSQFGRPMERIGMAFTFPQTPEQPHVFNLRLETWTQDPRSLWIENIGSFTTPVPTERLTDLSNLLFATYKFVTKQASGFVAHFDRP